MSRLQAYFSSEFMASGQGTEFHEFITRVTQAKSKSVIKTHVTYSSIIDFLNIGRNKSCHGRAFKINKQDGFTRRILGKEKITLPLSLSFI